jgi:hypothetical protein
MCTLYALESGASAAGAASSRLFVPKASLSAFASSPSLKLVTVDADLQDVKRKEHELMLCTSQQPGAAICWAGWACRSMA